MDRLSASCLTMLMAFIAGHSIARASHLCTPTSWEGHIYGKVALTSQTGVVNLYDIYQQVSYDYANYYSYTYQVLHNVMAQAEDLVMQIYEQPNLGLRFVALPKYRHCTKEPTRPNPFFVFNVSPQCLPDGAKYLSRLVQGGISVDAYQFSLNNGEIDVTVTYAPDSNNTPLTSMVASHREFSLGIYNAGNVTLGIRDPSVFVLPSYCAAGISSGPLQSIKPLADYF